MSATSWRLPGAARFVGWTPTVRKWKPNKHRGIVFFVTLIGQALALEAASLSFGFTVGGSQYDVVRAVSTDSSRNIFIVGETYSNDFPGASPSITRSSGDAFIVKLNSTGTRIVYSTILGGSGFDSARSIAVDAGGNAYIAGETDSSDFPATNGAFQVHSRSPGLPKAFVAKIDPSGGIVYASYLGGGASDSGYAIAVDTSGAAYVAGSTASSDFPVSSNAAQRTFHGGVDCFVAKVSPGGGALSYATFLGGQNIDLCKAIAADQLGDVFVAGVTASTDFPTVAAFDGALSGSYDAFIAKIDPLGDRFLFATYLGGESVDEANSIGVGPTGAIYVAGDTTSTLFPVTSTAAQMRNSGNYDGFVCAIANDGSAIQWATYLGGAGADSIQSLALSADGRIAVAGYTASPDFPTLTAIQTSFGGGPFDAFLTVFTASGNMLEFSTFVGGSGDDRAFGVASVANNQWMVAGQLVSKSVSYMLQQFSTPPVNQIDSFLLAVFDPQPLRYVPITPCRVADTRPGRGFSNAFGPPSLAAGIARDFPILNGMCPLPSSAQAFSLNVAVVPHSALGYLTVWPKGEAQPVVATLNSIDGRTKSSGAIVPAGAGGAISTFATNDTDLILDVSGYFISAAAPEGLAFYPVTPCRLVDTRINKLSVGPLSGGASRTLPVQSAGCNLPPTAQAYSLNFAVVPTAPVGYLTAYPTGTALPVVATLNDLTGTIVANAAIVPAGVGGSIDVFASNSTDLVVDLNGYFAVPEPGGLSFYNVVPCRAVDTRQPPGSPAFYGELDINGPGAACGAPVAAGAYVFNATVVPSASLGYLTMWPQGTTRPAVATLDALDGAITNNMAIVPANNAQVSVYATNPTQLVLDLFGYFAP